MKIQSLSICVPAGCPNDCKFCVSQMQRDQYKNQIEKNKRFRHLYRQDYRERLAFARDNGCNTMMFTGDGEPLANQNFVEFVAEVNKHLRKPFRMIELQTCGVYITDEILRWLRNEVRVSTISLSLSSIFSDEKNAEYNGTPEKLKLNTEQVCAEIKRYDFNLRLSLNMTDAYNGKSVRSIFEKCEEFGADQVTFRKLYQSPTNNTEEDVWIAQHKTEEIFWEQLNEYVKKYGRKLERLPFGAMRYSVDGISTVIDDDCMSTAVDKEEMKYLVLRENCKLYTKWDDKGSLLF
jgi:molybdenum cofactor biosynthesis enzyme MoaA